MLPTLMNLLARFMVSGEIAILSYRMANHFLCKDTRNPCQVTVARNSAGGKKKDIERR